jgi:hypothetical protein
MNFYVTNSTQNIYDKFSQPISLATQIRLLFSDIPYIYLGRVFSHDDLGLPVPFLKRYFT